MKKKILLLAAMLVVLTTVQASDDLWVDINFTRDSTMWKEAFPPLEVVTFSYLSVPLIDTDYLGYTCNGAFGKFAVSNFVYTPFNAENITEQFIYAFRLSGTEATGNWTFPGTSDVGKIKVNAMCGNRTLDAQFTLQKFMGMEGEGEEAVEIWSEFDPVVTFTIPPHDNSTTSFVVEQELNLSEPTKLRFKGPALRNVHIFAMSISKNTNSGVADKLMDKIQMSIVGRSLEVKNNNLDFTATVFDLAGVNMGKIRQNETYTFSFAGTYLVRVETVEGTITKKVVVL